MRPGQLPDGSLLLPLEKSRGGDEAPPFAVEIVYLAKATAWEDKGREKVTLPALDLPISRTGMLLYYPPLFRVTAEPGTFRTQEYQNPTSAALLLPLMIAGGSGGGIGSGRWAGNGIEKPGPTSPADFDRLQNIAKLQSDDREKKDATQTLLDKYKAKSSSGKVTGILPVSVSFPAFGPSIYLVSELTSENQFPAAEFSFQRDKKGGAR